MNQQAPIIIPEHASYDDDEIDIRQLVQTLTKHKWSILGLAFVITLLTTLVVFSIEPVYEASTSLLLESEEAKIVSIEEVYGIPGANREYFETQAQILNSRDLADKVFTLLNLKEHPEFLPKEKKFSLDIKRYIPSAWLGESDADAKPLSESLKHNLLVGSFMEMLNISLVRNSQIIKIQFESHYPELVAEVPNTLARVYISNYLEAGSEMNQQATGLINERLGELKKNLDASETALKDYIEKEQLIDVKGVDSLAAKELDEITASLVEARRKRSETEALYNQVRTLKGGDVDKIESIPAILNHPLIQSSYEVKAEADRKVSELSKRYGPKHPKMISAISEQQTADESLKRKMDSIIRSVEKDYEIALAEERHLSGALSRTKSEVKGINKKEFKLEELRREVESNRNLYNVFLTRLKETSATSDMQSANARIVDTAVVPTKPAKPKKSLIIAIAFLLSIMLGAMLAFLIEALDNTLKGSQDVEDKLHVPLLGLLPKLRIWLNKDVKALRYFNENKQSGFAEAIRTIRTGVLLTAIDEPKKRVVVTSSVPNEGKSAVSVNLALAMGQMGKVLLIDCDMRKPSIGKVFELDNDAKGLSEFISGKEQLDDCIYYKKDENLFVMPAGVIPPNPLELISSKRFKDGLAVLEIKFDHIVIDAAPILAVSDGVVLSTLANSVIYVVKAEETTYQVAQKGIARLHKVQAPLTGVVLNQIVPDKHAGKYGYYEGEYTAHYGYTAN
jgi:polysaccharide biosynthesis transport protein